MSMRLGLIFLSLFCLSNANLLEDSDRVAVRSVSRKSQILGKQGSAFFLESRTNVIDSDSGRMNVAIELGSHGQFEEVSYQWILPKGVALSWGESNGVLTNLSENNPAKLVIEVVDLNLNINQNIILFVEWVEGAHKLGSSFIISSRKDFTAEYQAMPAENNSGIQAKATNFDNDTLAIRKKLIY